MDMDSGIGEGIVDANLLFQNPRQRYKCGYPFFSFFFPFYITNVAILFITWIFIFCTNTLYEVLLLFSYSAFQLVKWSLLQYFQTFFMLIKKKKPSYNNGLSIIRCAEMVSDIAMGVVSGISTNMVSFIYRYTRLIQVHRYDRLKHSEGLKLG